MQTLGRGGMTWVCVCPISNRTDSFFLLCPSWLHEWSCVESIQDHLHTADPNSVGSVWVYVCVCESKSSRQMMLTTTSFTSALLDFNKPLSVNTQHITVLSTRIDREVIHCGKLKLWNRNKTFCSVQIWNVYTPVQPHLSFYLLFIFHLIQNSIHANLQQSYCHSGCYFVLFFSFMLLLISLCSSDVYAGLLHLEVQTF